MVGVRLAAHFTCSSSAGTQSKLSRRVRLGPNGTPANLQSPMIRLLFSGLSRFLRFHSHRSVHFNSDATNFWGCWSTHATSFSRNSGARTTVFARLAFFLPLGEFAIPPPPSVLTH